MTPESLEDDAKAQMKNVKAAGHKDIRWCGAYKVRAFDVIASHTEVHVWLETPSSRYDACVRDRQENKNRGN